MKRLTLSKNFPNPFFLIFCFAVCISFIDVRTVYALDVMGTVKSFVGNVGWVAAAGILTGLLAIGWVAKKANWLSGILIAAGTLITNIGLSVQDGKIEADELKQIKANIKDLIEKTKVKK